MRMRWRLPIVASIALLAGCTPAPQPQPSATIVPHELIQQYAQSCFSASEDGEGGFYSYSIGPQGSHVEPDEETPEKVALARVIETCLDRYQYEDESPLAFVTAYERAELYDYYTSRTRPCLAERGVEVPEIPRTLFFASDRRLWNPYPSMDGIPFDELLSLYRACPPVPDFVLSRHVTYQSG